MKNTSPDGLTSGEILLVAGSVLIGLQFEAFANMAPWAIVLVGGGCLVHAALALNDEKESPGSSPDTEEAAAASRPGGSREARMLRQKLVGRGVRRRPQISPSERV